MRSPLSVVREALVGCMVNRAESDRARAVSARLAALANLALGAAIVALFVHNAFELYFVGDDAFISFRYARNLADGMGLTWNPGERVEGYTNFLWVVIVAAGMRLGLEPVSLANALGIGSGFLILAVLVAYSRFAFSRISVFSFVAPLLLASNRTFVGWCTGGLETQFYSLLVLSGLLLFRVERERAESKPFGSSALFIAASLTRPEGSMFFCIVAGFYVIDLLGKKRSLRSFFAWALPYAIAIGAFFLWRRLYFGYWLPNTFYAKVAGLWFEQGLAHLAAFASEYQIALLAVPILALLIARRRLEHWLLAASIAAQASYIAAIGGDRFEFRFMVVVLPPIYWLFGCAVREIAMSPTLRRLGRATPSLAAAILVGLALLPIRLTLSEEGRESLRRLRIETIERTGHMGKLRMRQGQRLRSLIDQGLLPSDIRYATGFAGATPYYSGLYTIDLWGLNDVLVARQEKSFDLVAHRKWAPAWYLEQQKVDMIEVWGGFVMPIERSADGAIALDERCARNVRCIRVGEYVAVFETALSEEEFARRFAVFEILN